MTEGPRLAAVSVRDEVGGAAIVEPTLDVLRGITSHRAEELEEPEGSLHLNIGDLDETLRGS